MKKHIAILLTLVLFASCTKTEEFSVDECQLSYDFEAAGGTVFVTVNSDGLFKAESDAAWCYTEVYGIGRTNNLRVSVYENELAEDRNTVVTLTREGKAPISIKLAQKAAQQYISCQPTAVTLDASTLSFSLEVKTNTAFSFASSDWIHVSPSQEPVIGDEFYSFTVDALSPGEEIREGSVEIVSADKQLSVTVPVTQTQEVLPVLEETFDWAVTSTGSTCAVGSTSGEYRFDQLPEGTYTNGWTTQKVSNNVNVWCRGGHVRFNRTGASGYMISPALSRLTGPTDVVVTFKAARWVSSSGALDAGNNKISVSLKGSGTVSQELFTVENYSGSNPSAATWQDDPAAVYTFKISGASSDTQIVFLGAPSEKFSGVGRMLLDDVTVEYDN